MIGDREAITALGRTGAAWIVANPASLAQTETQLAPSVNCGSCGYSVAIDDLGRVVVVGAPGSSFTTSFGHAFVYRRVGTQWVEELVATGIGVDRIGESAAISADGKRFVVGAPMRLQGWGIERGAIDVYRQEPTGWALEASLFPTDVVLNHRIGVAIALSGDGRYVAGRTTTSVNSPNPNGAVYVFERTGSTWTQVAKLFDQVVYSALGFGWSLSFDHLGTLLAVGNPEDSRLLLRQGAVSYFARGQAGWSFHSVLTPHAPVTSGRFGYALDLGAGGANILIGGPRQWSAGVQGGAVEQFEFSGGAWQHVASYGHSGAQSGDFFGLSVAADPSGTRFVVTSPNSDVHGPDAGEVHFFRGNCVTPVTYCTSQTSSNGCLPQIAAAGTASASSSSGFVISASQVRSQQNGMLFYGTNGRATTAWLGGTLCVQPPLRRTPVINSGGNFGAPDCSGVLVRDFNAWASSAADPLLFTGQRVCAQFYSRDPGAASNLNLSDAVEFYLEP